MPQCMDDRRQQRRQHILIIGGTADFLHLIQDLLQERYDVTTTTFVPTAFAQIAPLDPDALIVDIAVGQQAGWELLERLHAEARTTSIPVLIVSTAPGLVERAQDQAARNGNRRYLAKPASFDEMLAQIQEMVGASPDPS